MLFTSAIPRTYLKKRREMRQTDKTRLFTVHKHVYNQQKHFVLFCCINLYCISYSFYYTFYYTPKVYAAVVGNHCFGNNSGKPEPIGKGPYIKTSVQVACSPAKFWRPPPDGHWTFCHQNNASFQPHKTWVGVITKSFETELRNFPSFLVFFGTIPMRALYTSAVMSRAIFVLFNYFSVPPVTLRLAN